MAYSVAVAGCRLWCLTVLVAFVASVAGCSGTAWQTDYLHGEPGIRLLDVAGARILLREQEECCSELSQLYFQTLEMNLDQRFLIDSYSQVFSFSDGVSHTLALALPAHRTPVMLKLRSVISDSVLAPTLLLLDEEYRVTRRIGGEEFSVRHSRIMERDSLYTEQLLMPDEYYLVIYSSTEQQQGFTQVPHPAKVFAEARGTVPPRIPDPEYRHAPVGNLEISVNSAPGSSWLGL